MTIAACYLSPEGVVLGADSTSTMVQPRRPPHYYDHEQKVFEIGEHATLGMVMWGVGGLGETSFRTMIAEMADDLAVNALQSVADVAARWRAKFWPVYTQVFAQSITRLRDLARINPRSRDEEEELSRLRMLAGGFCIGGRIPPSRKPEAAYFTYGPEMSEPTTPGAVGYDRPEFWGVPNLIHRVLFGMDTELFKSILRSGKWTGTPQELANLVIPGIIQMQSRIPLREAIDWVYSSIFITIKALKFSSLPTVCGGPIEVAVITSDRSFRWVTHKRLSEAIRQLPFQGEMR